MEKLSKMSMEDLQEWLIDKQIPMEVAESFEGGYTLWHGMVKGEFQVIFGSLGRGQSQNGHGRVRKRL